MHYTTIFDASSDPLRNWPFFTSGLILIYAAALLILLPRRFKGFKNSFVGPFGVVFLSFAVLWTALSATWIISGNLRARQDIRTGKCEVVQGVVENFQPMPTDDHGRESFTVRGVRFEYSDWSLTAGFNNTTLHGGPIRPGLPVRICYRDGLILRLEVVDT